MARKHLFLCDDDDDDGDDDDDDDEEDLVGISVSMTKL